MPILTPTLALVLLLQATQPAAPTSRQRARSLDVRVTDRTGATIEGARVQAEGPLSREGTTDASGGVTFRNLTAGSYRFRFEHKGFITLEKEVTVGPATSATVYGALTPAPSTPAPAPAPPPPPPSAPATPVLKAGQPRVLSIADFTEKQLITTKETTKETPIGCSGATAARLIQLRAPLAAHTHPDADEFLYVVTGEGTLKLGSSDHPIAFGTLIIVPRGMEHSVTRSGRIPVTLISTLSGQPCEG